MAAGGQTVSGDPLVADFHEGLDDKQLGLLPSCLLQCTHSGPTVGHGGKREIDGTTKSKPLLWSHIPNNMVVTSLTKRRIKSYTVTASVVAKKEAVSCKKAVLDSCDFRERPMFGEYHHLFENVLSDEEKRKLYIRMKPSTFQSLLKVIGPLIEEKNNNKFKETFAGKRE